MSYTRAARAGSMSRPERLPGWLASFEQRHGGPAGRPSRRRAPGLRRPSGPRTARWPSAMRRSRRCRRVPAQPGADRRRTPCADRRSASCWSGWAATRPACSAPAPRLVASKVGSRLVHGRQCRRRHVPAALRPAPGEAGPRGAGRGGRARAAAVFGPSAGRLDAVVLGGDRRAIAALRDDPRLRPYFDLAVDRFLTVPDPRLAVLQGHAAAVPRDPDPADRAAPPASRCLGQAAPAPAALDRSGRAARTGSPGRMQPLLRSMTPASMTLPAVAKPQPAQRRPEAGRCIPTERLSMISAHDIELRAGARLLLDSAAFQVAPGDKIGLVGRNGAGKTTLARVLAGEGVPAAGRCGSAARSGTCRRTPGSATSRRWPSTGSCPPAAWTRCWPACARPSRRWPAPTRAAATPPCGATATWRSA